MITLESAELAITLDPRVGGTITSIMHRKTGLSILGTVPWDTQEGPFPGTGAQDENAWLPYYTGGWPLLFPNGGDACNFGGVFHGFHGEASITPWRAELREGRVTLTRRFFTVPVTMSRTMSLSGAELVIEEEVEMTGGTPVDVMWGHHATFGSDLLSGPFEITSGAGRVMVDGVYDPAANMLLPGACGELSAMPGKRGAVDISRPKAPLSALLYLDRFDVAWAAIRRLDDAIAVKLEWDSKLFPCAWLWCELQGLVDPPWHGRAMLIGIEPNTTRPAFGLAQATARGGRLLQLEPGSCHRTRLSLFVFRPSGPIGSSPP
ncbi:hypothetical protein [Aestuariivirga sp.]|uniref:hypothetical protein n=1 Tax=Aestuariivirga sp. TaxID=2650926 RepID=UPI00391C7B02